MPDATFGIDVCDNGLGDEGYIDYCQFEIYYDVIPLPNLTFYDFGNNSYRYYESNGSDSGSLDISVSVINDGTGDVFQNVDIDFYLSRNDVNLSSNDRYLGFARINGGLDFDSYANVSIGLDDINSQSLNISPGTYYILALIDPDDEIIEWDEGDNNTYFNQPIYLNEGPNLTLYQSGTNSFDYEYVSKQLSVRNAVVNNGDVETGRNTFEVAWYQTRKRRSRFTLENQE